MLEFLKTLNEMWILIIMLIGIKALIIGSNYNVYYHFKYGKKYRNWYRKKQKETFEKRDKIKVYTFIASSNFDFRKAEKEKNYDSIMTKTKKEGTVFI